MLFLCNNISVKSHKKLKKGVHSILTFVLLYEITKYVNLF